MAGHDMGKVSRAFIAGVIMFMGIINSGYAENDEIPSHRDRLFNSGWKFLRDSVQGAEKPEFDDSSWMTVDLPHDYSIMNLPGEDSQDKIGPFSKKSPGNGNSTGHVIGGTGWYRKSFVLDKADEGKTVIINFDGIYMESEVWVNGLKAGIHKNGYTPFWFDITALLNPSGKVDVIAVKVENNGRNSRWYSGSGIYRNVYLTLTQPVHVAEWGVKITTPQVKTTASVIYTEITIQNDKNQEANVETEVNIKDRNGRVVASSFSKVSVTGNATKSTGMQLEVKNPLLWSLEAPNLYTEEISLKMDKRVVDKYSQNFGIRSLEFSAYRGFLLNGESIKLKGGCVHHDNGFLGSAAYNRAEERKVEILKENGYNAVRCAHNPPSTAFLEACDRLGMLVIDEFTDMWEHYKNPQDYSRFFKEWWNKDLTDMIMRDRNHPSIIMWSIGNEVYELEQDDRLRIGKELADRVKELDNTRAVTQSITDFFFPDGWGNTEQPFALLDICGYNYGQNRYEADHQKFPNRIMYASESYPMNVCDYWKSVEKYPWVIGEFVWTAIDYIGEVSIGSTSYVPGDHTTIQTMPAGFKLPRNINIFDLQVNRPSAWPSFVSGCGDIDITGERKPQKLYRDVIWDNSKIEMAVHAPVPAGFAESVSMWGWPDEWPFWNWKGLEDKPLQVRVFTKASHVRLDLNGKIIGEKDLTVDDKFIAVFEVPYQPGEIKAIALEEGKEIASKVLKTPGELSAIRLIADRNQIKADRNDLAFIKIEIVDINGEVVPRDSISVQLFPEGKGQLVASGTADPKDMASVNKQQIKTYKGKAQAIIRPLNNVGIVKLRAESQGLKTGELIIQVTK